jgi:hypothetical protein
MKKLPSLPEEVVTNHLSPFERFLYSLIKEKEETGLPKPKNSTSKPIAGGSNVKR